MDFHHSIQVTSYLNFNLFIFFNIFIKIYKDENQSIKFEIWDTAGQERYRALAKVFYKNAAVCVLVYDITRKTSFNELKNYWIKEIKENAQKDVSKKIFIKINF